MPVLGARGLTGGVVEFHEPERRRSVTASGAIVGGNVVKLTGNRICAQAGAGDVPYGIAAHDAADGEVLTVFLDGELPLVASGAINAGDTVEAGATGKVRVLASVDVAGSFDLRKRVGRATAAAVDAAMVRVEVLL